MTQTIQGFYEASKIDPRASLTEIVGNGSAGTHEKLTVNGALPPGASDTNPFPGAQGAAWDNPAFNVGSLMRGDDSSISTEVSALDASGDCLSFAAMVFSTTVQDSDNDGLLDIWESRSGLVDPNGQPLPNLNEMGANPHVPDIFVEIDYMSTATGWTTGSIRAGALPLAPTIGSGSGVPGVRRAWHSRPF
jgi:hypothetical protein